MRFEITKGKQVTAQKVVIYGPEGIGKSTFASRFPDVLFIDTEGSTKTLDVKRLPRPTSWRMLQEEVLYVKESRPCSTLAIDTLDWAEQLCTEEICKKHGKNGVEDFGYGNGYVYVKEEFGRFLNRLEDVIEAGIHVVLCAHAQIRKFEQPDEMGAYDRYELKLGKKTQSQTSPLVKEWADMLLFANYKTVSVAADKEGKKHKAQGGRRVMHTSHHPCWDAKNRNGLAEELPFEYAQIAHCVPDVRKTDSAHTQEDTMGQPKRRARPKQAEPPRTQEETTVPDPDMPPSEESDHEKAIKALFDLIDRNGYDRGTIQWAVSSKGYFPADTPIEQYPTDFIEGVLIGAWDKVDQMIKERLEKEIPF